MKDDRTNSKIAKGKSDLDVLLKKGIAEQEQCRQAKRDAQHDHWMRIMKEGQSTPDLSYQKVEV